MLLFITSYFLSSYIAYDYAMDTWQFDCVNILDNRFTRIALTNQLYDIILKISQIYCVARVRTINLISYKDSTVVPAVISHVHVVPSSEVV